MHKQQGWLQAWEYSQAKLIQTLGRASQGVEAEAGVSASRVTTLRRLQEKSYQATSEPETTSEASYLGWGEKELDCYSVVQSPLFRWKYILHFIWKSRSQSLEEEAQNPCCLKSSVKFPQSVMIWAAMSSAGVGPLCFLKSTVNAAIYQEILEHFMLPSADKPYGDADFIFQQDLAPAHTAKGTKSWFNNHGVTVLDWPANSPDLNPIENLWGIVKKKMRDTRPNNADELKATWNLKHQKPGLPYHLSSATNWSPPCHAELRQ